MYELRMMNQNEAGEVHRLLSGEGVYAPHELSEEALSSGEVYLMTYDNDIVGIIWISGDEVMAVYIHLAFVDDIEPGMFDLAKKRHSLLYGYAPFMNEGSWKCMAANGFQMLEKHTDYECWDIPGYIYAWGSYEKYVLLGRFYGSGTK